MTGSIHSSLPSRIRIPYNLFGITSPFITQHDITITNTQQYNQRSHNLHNLRRHRCQHFLHLFSPHAILHRLPSIFRPIPTRTPSVTLSRNRLCATNRCKYSPENTRSPLISFSTNRIRNLSSLASSSASTFAAQSNTASNASPAGLATKQRNIACTNKQRRKQPIAPPPAASKPSRNASSRVAKKGGCWAAGGKKAPEASVSKIWPIMVK